MLNRLLVKHTQHTLNPFISRYQLTPILIINPCQQLPNFYTMVSPHLRSRQSNLAKKKTEPNLVELRFCFLLH